MNDMKEFQVGLVKSSMKHDLVIVWFILSLQIIYKTILVNKIGVKKWQIFSMFKIGSQYKIIASDWYAYYIKK